MKRLAIFLDGTWNTLYNNTNVWRSKSEFSMPDCAIESGANWGQSELARDFRTLLRGDIVPEEVSDGKACPSQPGVQA